MKQWIKSLVTCVNPALVCLILMYIMHFLFALIQVILYKALVGVDGLFYILMLWNSYWFTAQFIILLHHYQTGDGDLRLYVKVMKHWWFVSSIKWLYLFVLKDIIPLIEELLSSDNRG